MLDQVRLQAKRKPYGHAHPRFRTDGAPSFRSAMVPAAVAVCLASIDPGIPDGEFRPCAIPSTQRVLRRAWTAGV